MTDAGVKVGLEAILKAFDNPTNEFEQGYVAGLQTALNFINTCDKAATNDNNK